MFSQLKKWFSTPPDEMPAQPKARRTGVPTAATKSPVPGPSSSRRAPSATGSTTDPDPGADEIGFSLDERSGDPGLAKNVLSPRNFYRVETGTFETLEIVDGPADDDDDGIDPYNTGDFDRSGKWDKRFRK